MNPSPSLFVGNSRACKLQQSTGVRHPVNPALLSVHGFNKSHFGSWTKAVPRQQHQQSIAHRHRQCKTAALPWVEAWSTHVSAQEIASNLFATSIFPYAAFLYYLTKSKKCPPVALFGFYFLLVFVFATIPAGIYALKVYHTSLANVDWLHGSAESMLTITNLLIVLGLRQGLRKAETENKAQRALQNSEVDTQPSAAATPSDAVTSK